ncbi:MAG TPA: hypothetical protein VK014_15150 [Cyclobacteriaceae bacterium]|nr:hypothetical protein [Cyclobacteriaceae bacterium]
MKLSAYISFILLLLAVACHSNHPEVSPQHSSALADSTWANHLTQKISLEELPVDVKEEIYNDEIFHGLDISDITKITKDNFTYYDMTFKDADGQLIMVFYDEKGEIIVPNN